MAAAGRVSVGPLSGLKAPTGSSQVLGAESWIFPFNHTFRVLMELLWMK